MSETLRGRRAVQLILGLGMGIVFGFLLHKGGVTSYDVIIGQLLLTDFTVLKVMLSAVVTGMVGIHLLRAAGLAHLHPKPGSWGSTGIGSLIFGVGFALLGYCPGTGVGAVGHGAIDAFVGTLGGITVGAWAFAVAYPRLQRGILPRGSFGQITLPELLRVKPWTVVIPVAMLLTALLVVTEKAGL